MNLLTVGKLLEDVETFLSCFNPIGKLDKPILDYKKNIVKSKNSLLIIVKYLDSTRVYLYYFKFFLA